MIHSRIIAAAGLISLSLAAATWACPIWIPQTISERYSEVDVVVIARCLPGDDNAAIESNRFEIVSVDRDFSSRLRPGHVLTHEESLRPETLVWLMGTRTVNGRSVEISWDSPIEMSDATAQYIRLAPPKYAPHRIEFFVKYLEHRDRTIADDAWREFNSESDEDIVALAKSLRPAKVRGWLSNPETSTHHQNHYGRLLGYCGRPEDAALLETLIAERKSSDDEGYELDGLMNGYLLLTKEAGLARLERDIVEDEKVAATAVECLVHAVRSLAETEPERVPKARLRLTLQRIIDRPPFAAPAVSLAADWKDWSLCDAVANLYEDPGYVEDDYTAIGYLHACARDGDDSANKPEHALAAQQHLDRLRERHPEVNEMIHYLDDESRNRNF